MRRFAYVLGLIAIASLMPSPAVAAPEGTATGELSISPVRPRHGRGRATPVACGSWRSLQMAGES